MLEQLNLSARIETTDSLKVGANPQPENSFTLVVTNNGETIQKPDGSRDEPFLFRLAGTLGSSEQALFLNETDAISCQPMPPTDDWKTNWDISGDPPDTFVLEILTFNKTILRKGQQLTVKFNKVVTKTGPGEADLSLETKFGSETKALEQLGVGKISPKPAIIAFYSDPPEGVQNLPGQDVTLKWRTYKLADRQLEQVGVGDPLLTDIQGDEGSYVVAGVTTDVSFKLIGRPAAERTLGVQVLKPGWQDRINRVLKGDLAYPQPIDPAAAAAIHQAEQAPATKKKQGFELEPTELINANDQCLYGVFRHTFQEAERSFLFWTENPFAKWKIVPCSVPNQEKGSIPAGFVTSPGVYFDDQIWLLGGSQIDPDNTSNIVWRLRLDPTTKKATEKGAWEKLGAAGWSPRMGHAVLVFDNRIWVMGGRDFANPLNDVWAYDPTTSKWDCVQSEAEWGPRCLFRPTVFNNQIWLFGGAKEPFSSELYRDVWVYQTSGKKWEEKKEITSVILPKREKPLASSLGVYKGLLRLYGSFVSMSESGRRSEHSTPLAFTLKNPATEHWTDLPREGLMDWGGDNTFSFQLVNYRDQMLIAKALEYDRFNPVLKVHVPPS